VIFAILHLTSVFIIVVVVVVIVVVEYYSIRLAEGKCCQHEIALVDMEVGVTSVV